MPLVPLVGAVVTAVIVHELGHWLVWHLLGKAPARLVITPAGPGVYVPEAIRIRTPWTVRALAAAAGPLANALVAVGLAWSGDGNAAWIHAAFGGANALPMVLGRAPSDGALLLALAVSRGDHRTAAAWLEQARPALQRAGIMVMAVLVVVTLVLLGS